MSPRPPTAAPRIACAYLPHMPVALVEREDPRQVGRPLAIATLEADGGHVLDRSYAAHLAGVLPEMSVAEARRLCPGLAVLPAQPARYAEVFRELLAALGGISPAVEPADQAQGWLAVAGLIPVGGSEQALADSVHRAVRQSTGLDTRVGLAHGKLTSRILTRYLSERPVMVLPAGKETVFLGGLPTHYLPLGGASLRALRELGVTRVTQYAALPRQGILPRYGYAGLRAWRLAHGEDEFQLRPWAEEALLEARHAFPEPIANRRSLLHHIGQLAAQLALPLARQFQMAGRLRLRVDLERGAPLQAERQLLEPLAGAGALATQAAALLDSLTLRAPVERLSLAAQGLCPTAGRQLKLFRHAEESVGRVAAVLERIQGRYGEDAVRQGQVQDAGAALHERRAATRPWSPGGRRELRPWLGEAAAAD